MFIGGEKGTDFSGKETEWHLGGQGGFCTSRRKAVSVLSGAMSNFGYSRLHLLFLNATSPEASPPHFLRVSLQPCLLALTRGQSNFSTVPTSAAAPWFDLSLILGLCSIPWASLVLSDPSRLGIDWPVAGLEGQDIQRFQKTFWPLPPFLEVHWYRNFPI